MENITIISIVAFAIIAVFSSSARAVYVLKCSGEKINKGDSTYSVLRKCGKPAFKETLSNEGCDKVEKWHYDCFGRKYVDELIFLKGILVDQKRGEESKGTQNCNP